MRASRLPLVTMTPPPGPLPGARLPLSSLFTPLWHPWSCNQKAELLPRAPPLYMGSQLDIYPQLRSCHTAFLCPAAPTCPAPLLCPMSLSPRMEAVSSLPGPQHACVQWQGPLACRNASSALIEHPGDGEGGPPALRGSALVIRAQHASLGCSSHHLPLRATWVCVLEVLFSFLRLQVAHRR